MGKTVYIYGLKDPNTGAIRYVGSSVDPQARLYQHIAHRNHYIRRSKRNARKRWVSELYEKGLRPELVVLEECTEAQRGNREDAWIGKLRRQGCDLFNARKTGEKKY